MMGVWRRYTENETRPRYWNGRVLSNALKARVFLRA